jgi:Tfp pilus assembly protein PilZ
VELRRFNRAPISRPVLFAPKDDDAFTDGMSVDISLGGMFIASEAPAPFGAEIVVHITLDEGTEELVLPAIVRWTRPDGMGVQFGLLGARETFAITDIVRRSEESQ